jgi:hypothetical protein
MKKILILALVAVTCSSCASLVDFLDSTTRLLEQTERDMRYYQPRHHKPHRRYCYEPYETATDSVSTFFDSSLSIL